jgi:hypothetical protein
MVPPARAVRAEAPEPSDEARLAAHRDRMNTLAVKRIKMPVSRITQAHRLVEHRVEHRREVARRRIDDLQHLSGRGLLLQRLTDLAVAGLQFVE